MTVKGSEPSSRLAEVSDMVLWDFKDGDDERHRRNTGVYGAKLLEKLFLLDRFDTEITLRCIMVKGVNIDEVNLLAIARTARRLKHCAKVELLPYHPFGGSKNEQLGFGDNGRREWIPDRDDMESAKNTLAGMGVVV